VNTGKLRGDARRIFDAAVAAVNPRKAVLQHVELKGDVLSADGADFDLKKFERIFVIGVGKSSVPMAGAVEEILGDRVTGGLVNAREAGDLCRVRVNKAGHPVPDEDGRRGAEEIALLAGAATERDLLICVISGGGSAMLPLPAEGLTLDEKKAITRNLLACGASVDEINTMRKHLSRIKGGKLARLAAPATVVTLILSDVVGDPLDVIASGPTVADRSSYADALAIVEKYGLKIPEAAADILSRGAHGEHPESPKPGDPVFEKVVNLLIATNKMALDAACDAAKGLGYDAIVLSAGIQGEAREAAKKFCAIVKEVVAADRPVRRPGCILWGGETTVTVTGGGIGGRNQEFVLAAGGELEGMEGVLVFSAGTDGIDGPTDAAGGFADGASWQRARRMGLDPLAALRDNDSYHLLQNIGDLLITGPTGTNVMDVQIGLAARGQGYG